MRWVSSILLILGMASPALAADYDLPILRGSQPPAPVVTVGPATFTRWSGFYFGGDFSFNNSSAEFSSATQPLFRSNGQSSCMNYYTPIIASCRTPEKQTFSAQRSLLALAGAGWSLGSTADRMAKEQSERAVVAALAPARDPFSAW